MGGGPEKTHILLRSHCHVRPRGQIGRLSGHVGRFARPHWPLDALLGRENTRNAQITRAFLRSESWHRAC